MSPPAPVVPRRRRGRRVAGVLLVAVVLVGIWAAVAAREVLAARDRMEDARDAAVGAVAALQEGDPDAARDRFAEARTAFEDAQGHLGGPVVRPLGVLPVAGDDLRTVAALADAGGLVAEGGELATGAVADLDGGLGALAPRGGALPVAALAELGPPVTRARELVDEAGARVDATPRLGLLAPVADARAELAAQLDEARATLAVAEPALRALPAFLGADGPRRYFFAASTPAELRGAIGFVGAYSVLTVEDGGLAFSPFSDLQGLENLPAGSVPPPYPAFETRYPDPGGASVWRNLVLSPDFPSTADAIERLWSATGGEPLDGVIAADPFALAALVEVSQPVAVPGGRELGADEVVPYITNEAYGVVTDPDRRKRLLGDVASATLTGFLTSGLADEDPLAAVQAVGSAVTEGHVLLSSTHAATAERLAEAGLDGRLRDPEGDFLAPFVSGTTSSKVDYYLERDLSYTVDLRSDGRAEATAEVALTNTAPTSGAPQYVIGPNVPGLEPGENAVYLSGYLAGGAAVGGVRLDGREITPVRQAELGHPVVEVFQGLVSGERRRTVVETGRERGWQPDGAGGGTYRLTLQHQVGVQPPEVEVAITIPPGMVTTTHSDNLALDDGVARFAGAVGTIWEAEIAFAPPPPPQAPLHLRIRDWLARPLFVVGTLGSDQERCPLGTWSSVATTRRVTLCQLREAVSVRPIVGEHREACDLDTQRSGPWARGPCWPGPGADPRRQLSRDAGRRQCSTDPRSHPADGRGGAAGAAAGAAARGTAGAAARAAAGPGAGAGARAGAGAHGRPRWWRRAAAPVRARGAARARPGTARAGTGRGRRHPRPGAGRRHRGGPGRRGRRHGRVARRWR